MYLAPLHSFGFASSAKAFLTIDATTDIPAQLTDAAFYILGEGSNTVFLEDFQGTVIKPNFLGIELKETASHYQLKVGAGENWHQLVAWCLQQGIDGFENLALIPGTVGAAPIQNIGAYGVEIERFIHTVEYFDLFAQTQHSLAAKDCEFAYRDSIFKHQLANKVIITSVTFALPKNWQPVAHYGELKALTNPSATELFNKVVEVRQSKLPDPKKIGNAGSFFKNPHIDIGHFQQLQQRWPAMPSYPIDKETIKVPAAWLIDQLGFKGTKVGGIGCHPKQALVLTNDGTGTGAELLQLAREIKHKVKREFSIELENEVRLMGKNGPVIL